MYLYKITCHNQRFYCIKFGQQRTKPHKFIHTLARTHTLICVNFCWKSAFELTAHIMLLSLACLLAWWLLTLKFLSFFSFLFRSNSHYHSHSLAFSLTLSFYHALFLQLLLHLSPSIKKPVARNYIDFYDLFFDAIPKMLWLYKLRAPPLKPSWRRGPQLRHART